MDLKKILFSIAALVFSVVLPTTSLAGLVPLDQLSNEVSFEKSKEIIGLIDQSAETKNKIEKLGLSTDEVKERIAALNDQEILNHMKNHNQAGGEVIVVSLGTVLLVVLILLILD